MTELTETEKLARTKRRELYWKWGVIAIILAALFLIYQGCQKTKSDKAVIASMRDSLQMVFDDTARIKNKNRALQAALDEMDMRYIGAVDDLQLTQKELASKSDRAKRLESEVKRAKADKDTVAYLMACDSLVDENLFLRQAIVHNDSLVKKIIAITDQRVKKSDSLASSWKESYDRCVRISEFVASKLPQVKPKSKLYIDGVAMTGYVNGLGGGLSLIDTKGNRFAAKYMMTNVKPIYQVEYGRLLSFKRK